MHICFVVFDNFSVLSQETGWEERLRNDLYCVEWDVKPQLNPSISPGSCFVLAMSPTVVSSAHSMLRPSLQQSAN